MSEQAVQEAEQIEAPEQQVEDTQPDTSGSEPNASSVKTEEAPQLSEEEQLAMERGWRPKEEFEGDVKKWVSAEEFLRRGELFEKIDSMGRDLRETKKALKMLQAHNEKLREHEINATVRALKERKKQAYEEGNHDELIEIDDQLLNLREEAKAEKIAKEQEQAQPDPRFVQWVGRNSWYTQDQELRNFGDEVGVIYARNNPDKSPDEVLMYVEKRVRTAYPEKFTNPNRMKPSSVSTGSAPRSPKSTEEYQLSEDERRVMNTFVRQGIMTKEEYIADLKKVSAR